MKRRTWDGKAVSVDPGSLSGLMTDKPFEVHSSEATARKLALLLSSHKAMTQAALEPEMDELLTALNYVIVADPTSVQAHSRLEAGKGMTPDGGYKYPSPPRDGRGFIRPEDKAK